MSIPPERPEPPQTPVPPLPPGFKLKAPPANPPSSIIELLTRRLESLERDLAAERDRAQNAQNMLAQQEALRGEVEAQLKTINEQLRREKNERESEEHKSHAQGRIDALEKRLDEMHQTWANLLKDAIAGKPEPSGAGDLAAKIEGRLADWERARQRETERLEESAQSLARERAAMRDALEAQHHAIREEHIKERIGLETRLNEQIAALVSRLEGIREGQEKAGTENQELKELFGKALAALNTPPKAKDQVILNLEQENRELMKGLRERSESLRNYALERRQIELTMGASLVELTAELAAEREKQRQLQARQSGFDLEVAKLNDKLEAAARNLLEKDERYASLSAERDGLSRFLIAEAAKVREHVEARREASEHWQKKVEELRARLEKESLSRLQDSALVSDLQEQIGALTGQMTKAIAEKDALSLRYAAWEKERQELLETLKKKEEMISMLSGTFQNMLRKSS